MIASKFRPLQTANYMKANPKINVAWHRLHPMPKNATIDQRIEWHLQHVQHCECRKELPLKLMEEMKKRGMIIPETTLRRTDHKHRV